MNLETATSALQTGDALSYRKSDNKLIDGAKTFVFLHGSGFSSRVFEPQLNSDVFAGHRVLAFDLPGHGGSKPLAAGQPYTFENMGNLLIDAFDTLDLSNITLVGWSLGGHIALDMLDRSDRISGAVICGAPPMHRGALSTLWAFHFSRDMLLGSKRQFTTIDAARFEKLALGAQADGRHIRDLISVDPAMRGSVAKNTLNGTNRDQHMLAANAEKPLLILQGADDPLVRTTFVSNFAQSVDYRGQFEIIDGAEHAPFLSQPEAFNRAVVQFADRSAQSATRLKSRRKAA